MKRLILLLALLTLGVFTANAQTYEDIDLIGYVYETGVPGSPGLPPSDPGDVLAGLGFLDGFSYAPFFPVADYEYTWVMDGLVSQGAVDLGNGVFRATYTGGTLDLIADPFLGAGYTPGDYGMDPPQAAAIGSFSDGEVYMYGTITTFVLTYDTVNGTGNYQGSVVFELGPNVGNADEELANPTGLTLAGTLDDSTVPQGYDLESDGHIYLDPTVPNEDVTWSGLKNLYR